MIVPSAPSALGLPPEIGYCLFDLDGVVTRTAAQHARAWKVMFDAFLLEWQSLREHEAVGGPEFAEFVVETDYVSHVDGRPRLAGTRTFLASRGIDLPEGDPGDVAGAHTLHGLSNRKNRMMLELIDTEGVEVFADTVAFLEAAEAAGVPRAVVTSSANAAQILEVTGLARYFDTMVDAHVAAAEKLAGKPAPDTFLAGAGRLGATPEQCVVFEDAVAGVTAAHAGGFGFVVGVDRVGQAAALEAVGADVVVSQLTDLFPASENEEPA